MMTVLEMDALIHIAMPSGLHDNSKTMILLMVLHVTTPRELNDTGTYSDFLMMLQDGDGDVVAAGVGTSCATQPHIQCLATLRAMLLHRRF